LRQMGTNPEQITSNGTEWKRKDDGTMKKILCVLLAGLMLAGCRNGNDGIQEAETGLHQDKENETMTGAEEVFAENPGDGLTEEKTPDADKQDEDALPPENTDIPENAEPEANVPGATDPETPEDGSAPDGTAGAQSPDAPAASGNTAANTEPLTWYLYQYTTGTGCFADTAMRPEHSGYIQLGSFCEDPWTLLETYTPATDADPYINGVTDGRYIIRDRDWFLYDAMLGTKEMLDFLPADAVNVYALTMDTQEIIGYAAENAAGKWAYYDLSAEGWITDYAWDGFSYSGAGNYITAQTTTEAGDYCESLINRTSGSIVGEAVSMKTLCNDKAAFVLADADGIRETLPMYVYVAEETEPVSSLAFSFVSLTEDGYLIAVPQESEEDPFRRYFQVYDSAGNLIHTSGQYGNVLYAYRDWVIVTDANRLLVLDREENVLVNFGKWSRNMILHGSLSGWKTNYAQTGNVPREYKYSYYELDENGTYIGRIQYQCPDGLYLLAEDESIPAGALGRAKWYFWNPADGKTGMLSFSAQLSGYTIHEG